jgi:hypothetical protein
LKHFFRPLQLLFRYITFANRRFLLLKMSFFGLALADKKWKPPILVVLAMKCLRRNGDALKIVAGIYVVILPGHRAEKIFCGSFYFKNSVYFHSF